MVKAKSKILIFLVMATMVFTFTPFQASAAEVVQPLAPAKVIVTAGKSSIKVNMTKASGSKAKYYKVYLHTKADVSNRSEGWNQTISAKSKCAVTFKSGTKYKKGKKNKKLTLKKNKTYYVTVFGSTKKSSGTFHSTYYTQDRAVQLSGSKKKNPTSGTLKFGIGSSPTNIKPNTEVSGKVNYAPSGTDVNPKN